MFLKSNCNNVMKLHFRGVKERSMGMSKNLDEEKMKKVAGGIATSDANGISTIDNVDYQKTDDIDEDVKKKV